MTVLWMGVIVFAGLGSIAAGVWLLILAFREHIGWGLACCLIPFAALAFAVKFWDEAKKPFLYSLGCSVLLVVGILGYSVSAVNAELGDYDGLGGAMIETDRPLSAAVNVEPVYSPDPREVEIDDQLDEFPTDVPDVDLQSSQPEEAAPEATPPAEIPSPRPNKREKGVVVPLSDLPGLVGELVQIVLASGERMSVRVESVEDGAVQVRRRVGGGAVTHPIAFDDIVEIRSRKEP